MLPTWIVIIQELKHVNTKYDEVHRQFMVTTKYITSYIKLTITLDLKHCQYMMPTNQWEVILWQKYKSIIKYNFKGILKEQTQKYERNNLAKSTRSSDFSLVSHLTKFTLQSHLPFANAHDEINILANDI